MLHVSLGFRSLGICGLGLRAEDRVQGASGFRACAGFRTRRFSGYWLIGLQA